MKTNLESAPLVPREVINTLEFPEHDVLLDAASISHRNVVLHHATNLGNLVNQKVNIFFEDSECIKKVTTTIWAVVSQKVFLKDKRFIPVNRIHSVDISY